MIKNKSFFLLSCFSIAETQEELLNISTEINIMITIIILKIEPYKDNTISIIRRLKHEKLHNIFLEKRHFKVMRE
jgi:hypothetical protein